MAKKSASVGGNEQEVFNFITPPPAPMPQLVCVGNVDSFTDRNGVGGRISKSELYVWQPVNLRPLQGGRAITAGLTYRPAWFSLVQDDSGAKVPFSYHRIPEEAGYNIHDAEEKALADKMLTVYNMNIAQDRGKGLSVLQGLTQTEENFNTLANRLFHLETVTIEGVQETLERFFSENPEVLVGYVLRQQSTKTGEFDSEGKEIRIPESRYELSKFFEYSPRAIESWRKSAARSNGGIVVTFDPDGPMF